MTIFDHIFDYFLKNTNGFLYKQLYKLAVKMKLKESNQYATKLPIQKNRIVFHSYFYTYACNPKYIAEEIIRQKLPYELIWIISKKNISTHLRNFPKEIKLVIKDSGDDFEYYSTAKIWIDNQRRDFYIRRGLSKKEDQFYIQTWHGSLGIKKTGIDRNDADMKALDFCKVDSSQIDYTISNSKFTTNFFKSLFFRFGKTLEIGHPRNDIFFTNTKSIEKKVREYYNIPENKRILLYAPTIREDKDIKCYNLTFEKLIDTLSKRFGGEWIAMTRLHHYILRGKCNFRIRSENVVDVTEYPDIQELLVTADCLITDYSSCIYDFMLQCKPAFIYASDLEKYNNIRGLYYPLESTPFPVAENNAQMVENIKNFDYEKYKRERKEFLDEKGCIDDGNASKKVVELIKQIMSGEEN